MTTRQSQVTRLPRLFRQVGRCRHPTRSMPFWEIGYRSGLLEKAAAEAFCHQQPDVAAKSPQQLAEALIRDGVLTRFQAEKLLAGTWRGFVIGGKYRLLERLGAGGMGAVYLCEHVLMGRRVALKVLPSPRPQDPASPGPLLPRGPRRRPPRPPQHRPRPRHRPRRQAALPRPGVRRRLQPARLRQAATAPLTPTAPPTTSARPPSGLQHAHEAGLVHRDIKPGNLLLDRQGVVKILDMGLARFFHDDGTAFASEYEHGYVIGTADYLAPEQTVDSRVDIRADIYSLGGTLYYLLVGKSPSRKELCRRR